MEKTQSFINKLNQDFWDANLYDNKHSFVSRYGNSLLDLLAPKRGERILDLGCGTGDLANKLFELGVDVIGVDKSENMIAQARSKYPKIPFFVRDATDLDFANEFNAVFSNATLHWVKPPEAALKCIYESLKRNGRFVAEFGGKGNVQTITDEIIKGLHEAGIPFNTDEQFPWYYPSIGEYCALMEDAGFIVTYAVHFDRPTSLEGENGLSNWIAMFASDLYTGVDDRTKSEMIANVELALRPKLFNNGNWEADYKRIRVIGIKE